MDLPRDSSDIQIAIACPICNGNGGIGPRTRLRNPDGTSTNFSPCDSCNGSGWQLKRPSELTAMQLARIVPKLTPEQATALLVK